MQGSTFSGWMGPVLREIGIPDTVRVVRESDDNAVCRHIQALVPTNVLDVVRYVLSDWMATKMNVDKDLIQPQLTPEFIKLACKQFPRAHWTSSEFIGPSLYELELWKEPGYLWMQQLTVRRVLDTLNPLAPPTKDTDIDILERVITLQSGFYKCVFVIKKDGSNINSLSLTRL